MSTTTGRSDHARERLAHCAGARVRRLVLAGTTPGWGGVPGSIRTLADPDARQRARKVTRPMVAAALQAEGSSLQHPIALANTAVRVLWLR